MIYIVLVILLIILIFTFIKPRKKELIPKEHKIIDSTNGVEYRKIDTFFYTNEFEEFDEVKFKKYLKTFPKEELSLVRSILDYTNSKNFSKKHKESKVGNKRKVEEVLKYIPVNVLQESSIGYRIENGELKFFIEILNSSKVNEIKTYFIDLAKYLRTDIRYFKEERGRFLTSINLTDSSLDLKLSSTPGELVVGSSYGKAIYHDYSNSPHLLISGAAGSGKSNYIKYILMQALQTADVSVVDWKGLDYYYYKEKFQRYVGQGDAKDLIDFMLYLDEQLTIKTEQLKRFKVTQYTDLPPEVLANFKPYITILEEYADLTVQAKAWLAQEQKEIKYGKEVEVKKNGKMTTLLVSRYAGINFETLITKLVSQGRFVGIQFWFVIQRPDADFLKGFVKTNINSYIFLGEPNAISLGMLGVTAPQLLTLKPSEDKKSGYFITSSNVTHIDIPYVPDLNKLVSVQDNERYNVFFKNGKWEFERE